MNTILQRSQALRCIMKVFLPNRAPSLVKLLKLNNNDEKKMWKIKLGEGGERDTKAVMTEASNPGNAIRIRVQWIKVRLLTRESFPARHSPQPKGLDQ